MSEDRYRSIGAMIGLAIGIGLMMALGYGGVIPGAAFGAGGCVAGAIAAEKAYAWNKKTGD
jgi:hypothetical protein